MNLLPAIDLLSGRAVRLAQGDYTRVTIYNDEPVAQACLFAEQGAEWLHVVDLDGARSGIPTNIDVIKRMAAETSLRIEVGGGMRTLDTIATLLDAGVTRVVLGSKLARDSAFVRTAVETFGADALVAGVDARDGIVAVEGWTEMSAIPAPELVAELSSWGLRHLVYTDIARDGMQSGINTDLYAAVAAAAGFPVIVSGGIARLNDVAAAAALGEHVVEGVIVGRALYEQAFDVREALKCLQENAGGAGSTPPHDEETRDAR